MASSSPSFEDLIDGMTLEVWHNMRTAVETGRWPDGRRVSDEQRALCMQAVIAWEVRNLPEEERSGYVPSHCKSADSEAPDQPVDLRPARRHGEH